MNLRKAIVALAETTGYLEGGDERYMPKHLAHQTLKTGDTVQLDSLRGWVRGTLLEGNIDVTTTNPNIVRGSIAAKLFNSMPKESRSGKPWEIEDLGKVNPTARYLKARALADRMDSKRAHNIWNHLLEENEEALENPFREYDDFQSARFVAVAAAMKLGKITMGTSHTAENQDTILLIEESLQKLGFAKPLKDVAFENPQQRNGPLSYHLL